MRSLLILALGLAAVAAAPKNPGRIVGGSITNIQTYPFSAVVMYSWWNNNSFSHKCGSTIINNRSVMSAAHCFETNAASRYRIRVGSTNSNSGGVVHATQRYVNHPNYRRQTLDSDIAVLRITGTFTYNNNVRAGRVAGANYNLGDNQVVWAIGWGRTSSGGSSSPQLRHVQIWTVNQAVCRQRYGSIITDNMLCSGWLDVGGRDQCQGDSGSPLLHNNIAVGVCSFGEGCGLPRFPGVNTRVSRFATWVSNNS